MKKTGLGRGLDALIDTSHVDTNGGSSISEIALSAIVANPDQPRRTFDEEALQELADSIREHGVISPITLRDNGDGTMSFYECACLWIYDVPMVRIRVSRSRETFIVKGQAARAHIHGPSVAFIRPIAQSHDTTVPEADKRIGNVMLAQQPSNRLKGIAFQKSREVKQNTVTTETDITGIA